MLGSHASGKQFSEESVHSNPKCLKTLNVLELISGGGWIQIKV